MVYYGGNQEKPEARPEEQALGKAWIALPGKTAITSLHHPEYRILLVVQWNLIDYAMNTC